MVIEKRVKGEVFGYITFVYYYITLLISLLWLRSKDGQPMDTINFLTA